MPAAVAALWLSPGSEYVLDVDMVVMAIGQGPNPLIKQTTPDLED